ncbi:hypothetical protein GCM10023201_02990 [Actinomycetospora corticicola]|uniref:DNA-binding protein n=1 Tax=Actinomycetospora corticicola TaxID=663602 RepID=A0A7Y9J9Z6_9PSEU|nr:hypothetical protein [Actinomycetospora corticicola]NYD39864.1 hypothetical protein [Actinomycetospora corticicola]
MDTGGPPLGERARRALLDHVLEVGDAAERSYLEVKTEVDLSKPAGVAKVAKFLLGAANRDPADASRYFGGYAVMVLGAGKGVRHGLPAGVEPHELEDRLRPYLGTNFPTFDLERLPADEPTREVLFVLAAPPSRGQPPYPCRKNFQGEKGQENLADGAIYVRGHSNTRPAHSGEIDALVERARGEHDRREIDIAVDALGPVQRILNADELMSAFFDQTEQKFRDALAGPEPDPIAFPAATLSGAPRRLSVEEREEHLARWVDARPALLAQGRDHLLGVLLQGMRLSVTSNGRYIDHPRLTVVFHDCTFVEHLEHGDLDPQTLIEPVMGRHHDFYDAVSPPMPMLANYPVRWETDGRGVRVTLTPDSLYPDDPWITEGDDYCILVDSDRSTVRVSWMMSERGNDEVYRGEFDVPTADPEDLFALFRAFRDQDLRDTT